MEFCKESITALALPEGKSDLICFDDTLPGFGIRLRAGGRRAWVLQYRTDGRSRRLTLGDARKLTLAVARAAAARKFAEITLGGDPQADKQAAHERAAITVGRLVDQYLSLKEDKVRKNTFVADKRYLANYWKPIHRLPIDTVSRRKVADQLDAIAADHGHTAAARARQSLSAFFTWAIKRGFEIGSNPVMNTEDPAAHIDARDRVLSTEELRAIWANAGEGDFGLIVRLLMLTGCRRDEIGGLKWSELDVEGGVLTIPGTRTKNHHLHRLELPNAAVALIRKVTRRGDREFLFGRQGGPFSRWSWEKQAIDLRVLHASANVAPWRIHDLRRTVATGMAEIGIDPHIIEEILNHRSGHKSGVAGIYNRATYESQKRAALARWADYVACLVDPTESKVVLMRRV